MGLTEQVIAFPLVGGVDESTPSRLCSRLLTMSNCRQIKSGSLEKRFGTVCQGTTNARLGGGTPPTPELLATYGSELVRIGHGHVDTCRVVGSTDCIYKGRASEALIYRQTLTSGESYIFEPDVAFGNGLTIYVCRSTAGSTTSDIVYFVLDANGSMVVPRTVIATAAWASLASPRVVVVGTVAVITYWLGGTGIVGRALDLTTLAMGGASTLTASLLYSGYALGGLSDRIALVYETDAGDVKIGTWTSAFVVATSAVTVASGVSSRIIVAVEGRTGGTIYVALSYNAGGSIFVKTMGFAPATLITAFALATIHTAVTAEVAYQLSIGLDAAGTTAWYAWSEEFTRWGVAYWAPVSSAGSIGSLYNNYNVRFASKPWADGGNVYALVKSAHETHGTHFLVQLYSSSSVDSISWMRVIGVIAPRQSPRGVEQSYTSSVVATASGRYAAGIVVSGSIVDSAVASLLDIRLGATHPVAAQAGGLLVCSGGVVTAYDGADVAELGMAWEPDRQRATATIAAGGSMTAGIYYYLAAYEWRFANGAVVRSVPSYPFAFATVNPDGTAIATANQGLLSVTAAGGNLSASLAIPFLNLTNKQPTFTTTASAISIVLYRTEAGGSTFYRASEINIANASLNLLNGDTATITDGISDATLRTRPVLYTTGGALPSEIPPSAAHVAVIQNRVWLSGTDDDTIWISHEIVDGEAPTFSGSVTIAPFDGGRVVGVAQLNDLKIILKATGVYVVSGTGPAITGLNGSFSTPERVPGDVGCIDARSIVSTEGGVMFLSQDGIVMLAYSAKGGFSATLIGTEIEDSTAEYGVVAASTIPDQGLVRFALETPSASTTLEYDTWHGGAWGTNVYASPGGTGTETICGATYCRGSWWYINSSGLLYQETKASWLDTKGASTSYVVQRARLRYISLGDLQGFARVWYVSALGVKKSPHDLTMKLYIDDQASSTQTTTFTALTIASWSRYQAQVHVAQQECEALSVEVYDGTPTGVALTDGRGFQLIGVSAEVGLDKPLRRTPAAQTG